MEDVAQTTEKQLGGITGKGFMPGQSGNPAGRPKGSVSIITRIKQKFEEDPTYFNEWVDKLLEDPANRRSVMEQIDGKPKQSLDVTSGGEPIQHMDPHKAAIASKFEEELKKNT